MLSQDIQYNQVSTVQNPVDIPWNPGWFIGILKQPTRVLNTAQVNMEAFLCWSNSPVWLFDGDLKLSTARPNCYFSF